MKAKFIPGVAYDVVKHDDNVWIVPGSVDLPMVEFCDAVQPLAA